MINHSFSCYLCLRHLILNPTDSRIKKLILLSPVGITPKENDYKNTIHSCGDIWHTLVGKLGWNFNLSYKSIFRTICCCLKKKILTSSFSDKF